MTHARYKQSRCAACGQYHIRTGDTIVRYANGWAHIVCASKQAVVKTGNVLNSQTEEYAREPGCFYRKHITTSLSDPTVAVGQKISPDPNNSSRMNRPVHEII
jgi:hypothetical protein